VPRLALAIACAAQHAAEARLAAFAAADVAVQSGRGWFAARTGVDSNDMNAVVSTRQAEISQQLVEDLIAWFRAAGASASWLTSRPAVSSIVITNDPTFGLTRVVWSIVIANDPCERAVPEGAD
jgi:hypothetical protein